MRPRQHRGRGGRFRAPAREAAAAGLASVAISLLIIALAVPVAAQTNDAVVSNMDLMNRLTGEVVDDLMGRMAPSLTSSEIVLVPAAADERYDFIDNVFTKRLTQGGYRVIIGGTVPGDSVRQAVNGRAYRIEYQATDFNLQYPKIYRSHLIGGKTVERSAAVQLIAKVIASPLDALLKSGLWYC